MSYNLPRILNNLTHDVTHVNSETEIRISAIESKTQNIATIVDNTAITGNLDITPTTEILNVSLFDGVQDHLVNASDYSYGMRFTITQPISIIRLGIWLYHWRVSVGNLTIKFWNEGNNTTPISTNLISQLATYQPTSYFYTTLVTPILLPIGTYRMSTGYKVGMFYNGALTLPFTWPRQITNIQSANTNLPNGAYPINITSNNITAGSYFWFDIPPYSNLNVTTLNNHLITTSSLICPEIKTTTSEIGVMNHINMNSNNLTNVGMINGSKVYTGRVYCETSTFAIAGQVSESNFIMMGINYGSIIIPSNTFNSGDTFLIKFGGKCSCAIAQTFTLKIRLNFISAQPQLPSPILASFNFTADTALTNVPWNVEAVCSLRYIDATAIMFTDARFSYFDTSMSGILKGIGYNASTIINTTIENKFLVTYTTPNLSSMLISNILINKLY